MSSGKSSYCMRDQGQISCAQLTWTQGRWTQVGQRICQAQRLSSFFPMVGADPLTLQARMTCRCEDDRHVSGSWQFGLNGQMSLHFDLENGHWKVGQPGGRWMKEKWENDRAVTDFLKKVSMGDCRSWLQDFMVHWEKMLKTSGK